jgi:hypothetical protein
MFSLTFTLDRRFVADAMRCDIRASDRGDVMADDAMAIMGSVGSSLSKAAAPAP